MSYLLFLIDLFVSHLVVLVCYYDYDSVVYLFIIFFLNI